MHSRFQRKNIKKTFGTLKPINHGLFTDSMTQKHTHPHTFAQKNLKLLESLPHSLWPPRFSPRFQLHRRPPSRTLEDLGKWVPLLGSKSPLSSTAPSSFLLLSLTQERAQLEGASGPRLPSPWTIFPSSSGKKISKMDVSLSLSPSLSKSPSLLYNFPLFISVLFFVLGLIKFILIEDISWVLCLRCETTKWVKYNSITWLCFRWVLLETNKPIMFPRAKLTGFFLFFSIFFPGLSHQPNRGVSFLCDGIWYR